MVGLFRTLLILGGIYVVFKLFTRIFLPYMVKEFVKNMGNDPRMKSKPGKEGDVQVEYKPGKDKKIKGNQGDYIDFEEIE